MERITLQDFPRADKQLLLQRLTEYLKGIGHPRSQDGFIQGLVGPEKWKEDAESSTLRAGMFLRAITGRRITILDQDERLYVRPTLFFICY